MFCFDHPIPFDFSWLLGHNEFVIHWASTSDILPCFSFEIGAVLKGARNAQRPSSWPGWMTMENTPVGVDWIINRCKTDLWGNKQQGMVSISGSQLGLYPRPPKKFIKSTALEARKIREFVADGGPPPIQKSNTTRSNSGLQLKPPEHCKMQSFIADEMGRHCECFANRGKLWIQEDEFYMSLKQTDVFEDQLTVQDENQISVSADGILIKHFKCDFFPRVFWCCCLIICTPLSGRDRGSRVLADIIPKRQSRCGIHWLFLMSSDFTKLLPTSFDCPPHWQNDEILSISLSIKCTLHLEFIMILYCESDTDAQWGAFQMTCFGHPPSLFYL